MILYLYLFLLSANIKMAASLSAIRETLLSIVNQLDQDLKAPMAIDQDVKFHLDAETLLKNVMDRCKEIHHESCKRSDEYLEKYELMAQLIKSHRSGEELKPSKPKETIKAAPIIEVEFPKLEDTSCWKTILRNGKLPKPVVTKPQKSAIRGSALAQAAVQALVPAVKHEAFPGIWVPSVAIKTPEECHQHLGSLCYHSGSRRFWISMNGIAIPHSLGKILWRPDDLHRPFKSSEFDPSKNCPPKDYNNYYFPEELDYQVDHPIADQRNFPTSMVYCPAGTNTAYPAIRVGDPENFIKDIALIKDTDARYAADHSSHHALMGYLLRLYRG